MKTYLAILASNCLLTSSCTTLSPGQKRAFASAGEVSLNLAQAVANTAIQVVLAKATSDTDLSNKGNLLDSAAAGLRTLDAKSGGIVTPQMVSNVILQFTDSRKSHWGDLANTVSQKVETSTLPKDKALEVAAITLNEVAAKARISATQP